LEGAVDCSAFRFKVALPLFFYRVLLGVHCIPPRYPPANDCREQRKNGSEPNLHWPIICDPAIV
jgi:hypothetical protein